MLQEQLAGMDATKQNLNWFSFETRIRNIVYELLNQPMESVKKIEDSHAKITEKLTMNKRRIDEHDFLLYKFQKRTDIEAEYESRITNMEAKVGDQMVKANASLNLLISKVDYCEKTVKSSVGRLNSLDQLVENFQDSTKV